MILKINVELEDMLCWVNENNFSGSSTDLTDEELVTEFTIKELIEYIRIAKLKKAKREVTVTDPVITEYTNGL